MSKTSFDEWKSDARNTTNRNNEDYLLRWFLTHLFGHAPNHGPARYDARCETATAASALVDE